MKQRAMQEERCISYLGSEGLGLGVGWRGVGRACRATSRTASSSSLLSKDQIFSHRSGSTTAGWGSAAQACEQGG